MLDGQLNRKWLGMFIVIEYNVERDNSTWKGPVVSLMMLHACSAVASLVALGQHLPFGSVHLEHSHGSS